MRNLLLILLVVLVFGLAPIHESWGLEGENETISVCWEDGAYKICEAIPVTPGYRPPLVP